MSETATSGLVLHGYWRSSATYRVRIGLALKGLAYARRAIDLRAGEQDAPAFRAISPQGLVPCLELGDGTVLTQSLAILDYLDERWPDPPFLPSRDDLAARARTRAAALAIACDVHPLNNLGVLRRLRGALGADGLELWQRHWIARGFAALEQVAAETQGRGTLFGDATPGLADILLVPQLYNARRCGLDLAPFPRLVGIDASLRERPVFHAARPEADPAAV